VTVSNLLLPLFGTIWQKMKNQEKMGPGPILQERGRSQLEDITAENGAWPHFFFCIKIMQVLQV
jgi:hypothetical protein